MKAKSIYTKEHKELTLKLVRARKDAGLDQIDVAKKLGRPQSFVSKMESGHRRLDIIELKRMAKLYGKPLSYFFPEE